jgi:hypothetical protein
VTTMANADSVQTKAYNFTTQYSSATNPDLDFNLRMLKQYYQLDKKYQDNLKNIKQEIENNIYYKFYSVIDTFYSSLRNKTFNAATFFNDSVSSFGNLKNLTPGDIQSKIDALAKTNITNSVIDTTLNFTSDASGFYVSFREHGNVLLDELKEYKTIENDNKVGFADNFRIKSFQYSNIKAGPLVTTVATAPPQKRIDLFTCGTDRSGQVNISRAMLLLKKQNYNVVRRSFKNPEDKNSPYYVSGNEIRYDGADEAAIANKLKALLEQNTNAGFSTKKVRTVTPNVISIFICQDGQPNVKQTDVKY